MGMSGLGASSTTASSAGVIPEKKPHKATTAWNTFQQSRLEDSNTAPTTLSAVTVAASLLGLEDSEELTEGSSIIYVPPGTSLGGKEEPSNSIYMVLEGTFRSLFYSLK